jgi:hypothetical protein
MLGTIRLDVCLHTYLYECSIITASIANKMQSGESIKQVLYSAIEEIGRESIQLYISSNIMLSQKYLNIIMNQCIAKLSYVSDVYDRDLDIIVLSEALLHYMLTISTLPSERKVEIKHDQALDIVIPSLPILKKDPNKSLVIQVIKDKETDLTVIDRLESLQPYSQNIWCISARPLSIARYTEYSIFPNHHSHKYSNIITDIDEFLKLTNDKSFRFVP